MKKIIIVLAALLIILVAPFIIRTASYGFGGYDLFDSWDVSDSNSIDGTYTWSDGWSSVTVDISGDTWYGEVSFGPCGETKRESGRVKGNSLYSGYAGWIVVGRVSGRNLTYGNSSLRKQE